MLVTDYDKDRTQQFLDAVMWHIPDSEKAILQDHFAAHREAVTAELQAENNRLRAMLRPQWFYADGYDQDGCCDSPEEVLEYLDLRPGKQVLSIDCAVPLPSLWYVVHVLTEDEMDAMKTDDREIFTEYLTEDDARKALAEQP